MTPPRVLPTADPGAAYQAAAEEIQAAVRRVLESGRYILGPEVEAFETEFAAYLGAARVVAVATARTRWSWRCGRPASGPATA